MALSTLSNFSQHLQMVIKRRSLSNVSTLSVHDKINRYHALTTTDLSPETTEYLPPGAIDEVPKKQRAFIKHLKKANVFNFIRKRAKTDLKVVGSITNLAESGGDRFSKDFSYSSSESRPISDPGSIQTFKSVTFNDPKYLIFASFSFGNGQSSKSKIQSRKDFVKHSKYIYRCILYSSEALSVNEWEMIGCSEHLILSDDLDLQFSFVTPFEIRYDYEADTTLKFELQQSRLVEKCSTYSETQNLSIDKVRRIKPSENNGNKFSTIASTFCELNKLANRGFYKSEMSMNNRTTHSICSIYLGAEPATIMEKSQGSLAFDLHINLKQSYTTEQFFNTYTPYKIMISRFFKAANAFISIYKSREFSLTFSSLNFRAEINDIELNQCHFLKLESMFRIAIIEANTEKWRCCGDIPISSFLETRLEIPIVENLDPETRLQKSILRTNIGSYKIYVPFESTNKISNFMNVPKNKTDLISSSSSSTLSTPYCGRSFSVGENQRPYKISSTVFRSESIRESASLSSRPTSKIDQDILNNNNIENKSNDGTAGDDENVGTIIANGHTQAYLMSLLQPTKRILIRQFYPDREVITEYQP